MSKDFSEETLFKALSHPTRRKILRYIGSHGEASYTELAQIEPKSGVLYHHLKILGGLIYQDDNKLYKLTEKGYKALDFLESIFLEPKESSFHSILTPRKTLEKLEDLKIRVLLVTVFLASSLTWFLNKDYILIFLVVAPIESRIIPPSLISIISWAASSLILLALSHVIYGRYGDILQLLSLNTIPFIIVNLIPLIYHFSNNIIVNLTVYVIFQLYALLLVISSLSVATRLNLRKSGLLVIILHYISIIIYIILVSI